MSPAAKRARSRQRRRKRRDRSADAETWEEVERDLRGLRLMNDMQRHLIDHLVKTVEHLRQDGDSSE